MKKILFSASAFVFVAVSSAALVPTNAEAIPVFARKYGLACASCHTMFPKLTKMGVAFRERGFRFSAGRDDIDSQDDRGANFAADEKAVFASSFPFTVRTQILATGAGPTTADDGKVVMPGHRPGMLDGASPGNYKVGFGEFGLISAGSYDKVSWWLDASLQGGIGMLEGIYYVNDLLKVRFGRVQNNVGYGMTMMSTRPLAYGWNNAAQMAGGTMLMMADGVSVHGTTNGDSGVGTYYDFTFGTYGKDSYTGAGAIGGGSTSLYGRVAQEISDNYIVGIYGYQAKNYTSDVFGATAPMKMAMGAVNATTANNMSFKDVTRYGLDFALNYGEPVQFWGAYTLGSQTSYANQALKVQAFTLSGEWKVTDSNLLGIKYDSSRVDLQAINGTTGNAAAVVRPNTTTNTTLFGIHQIAENVQAILSFTQTNNQVDSMGRTAMMGGNTIARQRSFQSGLLAIDIAL